MSDDRPTERELTTADLAAANPTPVERDYERDVTDREAMNERVVDHQVVLTREPGRADVDQSVEPLLPSDVTAELRSSWTEIQAAFVDEPRRAVERADTLVADAIKRLAESFANARARLEKDWDRGDDVSTEDLRLTLQKYRSFFGRLLEV